MAEFVTRLLEATEVGDDLASQGRDLCGEAADFTGGFVGDLYPPGLLRSDGRVEVLESVALPSTGEPEDAGSVLAFRMGEGECSPRRRGEGECSPRRMGEGDSREDFLAR